MIGVPWMWAEREAEGGIDFENFAKGEVVHCLPNLEVAPPESMMFACWPLCPRRPVRVTRLEWQ